MTPSVHISRSRRATYGVTAGDTIVQQRGWWGRWNVTEAIRRAYSIGVSRGPRPEPARASSSVSNAFRPA